MAGDGMGDGMGEHVGDGEMGGEYVGVRMSPYAECGVEG
jgi:hypothetical protein